MLEKRHEQTRRNALKGNVELGPKPLGANTVDVYGDEKILWFRWRGFPLFVSSTVNNTLSQGTAAIFNWNRMLRPLSSSRTVLLELNPFLSH